MKKTFTISVLLLLSSLLFSYSATSQEYRVKGNEVINISTGAKVQALQPIKTELIHIIKGVEYPVFKSARGKYFIIRTSKNTGKDYKQYLKIS
jgi:hypothetical protein